MPCRRGRSSNPWLKPWGAGGELLGGELLGGVWILLVSQAALRAKLFPVALNWIGVVMLRRGAS